MLPGRGLDVRPQLDRAPRLRTHIRPAPLPSHDEPIPAQQLEVELSSGGGTDENASAADDGPDGEVSA